MRDLTHTTYSPVAPTPEPVADFGTMRKYEADDELAEEPLAVLGDICNPLDVCPDTPEDEADLNITERETEDWLDKPEPLAERGAMCSPLELDEPEPEELAVLIPVTIPNVVDEPVPAEELPDLILIISLKDVLLPAPEPVAVF